MEQPLQVYFEGVGRRVGLASAMGEGEETGDGLGFTGCDGEGTGVGAGVGVKVVGGDGVSVAVSKGVGLGAAEGVGLGVAVWRLQSHSSRIAAIAALSLQKSRKGRSEKQFIYGRARTSPGRLKRQGVVASLGQRALGQCIDRSWLNCRFQTS